ncbi:MAG TPA: 3-phosphoshikimate 1-carboxyvinyltransferase [Verrucomicrobiae bacterium]|jgi:3-phosphoshikimate 1-carboxyvinyltransferase
MALPELIEIVPLTQPVKAEITVPGSKSITNRALILAALADGEVTLAGALWSEDTQIMVECLQKLGFEIRVENDPDEFCNRTITVKGLGGKIPKSGTGDKPLELFVGNAGTAARFLSAFVCLGDGVYRLSGVPRMHERPQAALFKALRELGYEVESQNDKLPAKIGGKAKSGKRKAETKVSIEESSQFASALLLCAKFGGWRVKVVGENAEESPYVAMTAKLMEVFPFKGGKFQIEPDASSGSYFWAMKWEKRREHLEYPNGAREGNVVKLCIGVARWPHHSDSQIDKNFPLCLAEILLGNHERSTISRISDLGDSIMTAIVVAPFFENMIKFADLGRLRVQECERVVALRTELTKCGAKVVEEGDTLTVYPSELHGAEIETYNDHRMAMCFAVLGLKVPGMKIRNPACVKKTFPNFFQKLAEAPPRGLGATILDAKTGRKLSHDELFAD